MENSIESKVCRACKKVLPLTDFNKGTENGYDFRCRACQKLYRQSEGYREANRLRSRADYTDPVKREAQRARVAAYCSRPEVKARRLKGYVGKSDT